MHNAGTLLALCLAAAACSGDGDADARVLRRDTTVSHRGTDVIVRIVESTPDSTMVWRIDDVPLVDLGGGESEQTSLYRVAGAFRLPDGRIAVADGGSTQLKIFDGAGALDTAIGGPGEGPGEFRDITWVGRLPGDSLVVWDFGLARVTVFDPAGARVREFRNETRSSIMGVFADASMLSRGFISLGGRSPSGIERHGGEVLHLDANAALSDSLGVIPGAEGYFISDGHSFTVFTPPFGRSTEIIAAGDRLYVADTERPEIQVRSRRGAPQLLVRWESAPRTIGAQDIDRARQHVLDEEGEARRENVERMFRDMPMPEVMPAFRRLRVDRDGHMWVQRYRTAWDEGMSDWLVFSSEGEYLAEVALPGALLPTDIGADYVLGIERDDLDVEHVRLYRLHRS